MWVTGRATGPSSCRTTSRRDDDAFIVPLASADLRFVAPRDDRGPGLCGIDLEVADAEAIRSAATERGLTVDGDRVDPCGVRFRLLQAS